MRLCTLFITFFCLITVNIFAVQPEKPILKSGEFVKIYDPSIDEKEQWYINDHCFIQGPKNKWHLFGITHQEPANPLDEDNFAHATAKNLLQKQWDKKTFALTVNPNPPWNEEHLWAPHIILHNGVYYMFYCAGDKDNTKYKIHLATSPDLKTWKRHPKNPMIVDGFDARDPCILKLKDKWIMYYTANRPAHKGNHVVMAVTSDDLINWKNPKVVFTHPTIGTFGGPTESPFVVERNGKFYLFLCTNTPYDDSAAYVSDNPFHWDIKNKVGKFPAHAAEIFQDNDGKWFISRAGWGRKGVYLAPLIWSDDLKSDYTVSLKSLLTDMTDLKKLSEVPCPEFKCTQFSSYDRASNNPDDTSDTNWFANDDCGKFLRTEIRNGNNEFVMMDTEGPGAIVRIWSANANGIIRFYFDGNSEPEIEMPLIDLLNGSKDIFPSPISGVRGLGQNCFLPISYAKHCKVTLSVGKIYYQINCRTYEPGTKVETFSIKNAKKNIAAIKEAAKKLSEPEKQSALPKIFNEKIKNSNLNPNDSLEFELKGPNAIYNFICKVNAENLEDALRGTLLEITFDNNKNPSVQTPLGDFFATAPGLNFFKSIPLGVLEDGTMYSHYVMPFKKKAKIKITNYSSKPVKLFLKVDSAAYNWNENSQYFFAKWRSLNNHSTFPRIDWTLLDCEGKGTYLGNMYQVSNPVANWWGEGDEKIYVDGEKFPSTFGTGTEDYYGYAWCWFGTFSHAFHNQVRSDGPGNFGHSCVSRFHFLDAIPFNKSIKFDIEIWHHICNTNIKVSLASTVYWYARPGEKDSFASIKKEELVIPELPSLEKVPGAIEGENMKILKISGGVTDTKIPGDNFPMLKLVDETIPRLPLLIAGWQSVEPWHNLFRSGGRGLWWFENKPGDFIEIEFNSEKSGTNNVIISSTKGEIFGNFNISINGQPAKEQLKFRFEKVIPSGEINLGSFFIKKGKNKIKVEVPKESNPLNDNYFFLLDYIKLEI